VRRLAALALLAAACSGPEAPTAAPARARPVVCTVNYPLQYFALRIAGDRCDVRFPAPADVDPAFWEPDDDTVAAYQQADLVLLNGATYAKWVDRASLPPSRCVDTSASFRDRFVNVPGGVTHSHGPGGPHTHTGTAFTTWLDPVQALAQAGAIRDALQRLRPADTAAFAQGYEALAADLREIDQGFAAAVPKEPLLASHPVYQYWARRYGLDLRSVLYEPDVVPNAEERTAVTKLLAEQPAHLMVWEGEPARETVSWLAGLGVKCFVVDPCGNRPAQGDYLTVMRQNLANVRAASAR